MRNIHVPSHIPVSSVVFHFQPVGYPGTEMTWWSRISLPAALLVAWSAQPADAGNTTCVSRQLDWYTSVVGESPCVTYQRLRRICNNDYQVPSFAPAVPGDKCDDQMYTCCSNTIAFQLSMLCMVCQQDRQDAGGLGIDAQSSAKGSFDIYINGHPATNNSIPDGLQRAVCNNNIRLDDYLYNSWNDGSWFYVYTKENAEFQHAANDNNTFTHCPNQTSASSTSSSSTRIVGGTAVAATSTPAVSKSHGTLIGGVVGGVGGLTALVVLAVVWLRVRRRTRTRSKGSQWTQNPHFGNVYSSAQASAAAPKSSLAQSLFSLGGPLSSKFSYCDPDFSIFGGCTTSPGTAAAGWSSAKSAARPPSRPSPARVEPRPRPDDDAPPDPRSFPATHDSGTGAPPQDGDRSTRQARPPSSAAAASVSLSTFDFASSQGLDDGQTMRSFPFSAVTTNEFAAFRNPSAHTHTPGRWRSGSKGRLHYS
ncbi:hypothetical protein GSI_09822 [Ganoderma sinense ZZ0214-1]|uniref:Uncharacterized protein n=1 Tax=Ganoderma sinense ZZ0214-1 TaxID=1077348 RepID=A0A2G8S2S0_9APHY|nr:hypothetical protein GSI_09822 [Ganoderma sinense ZZ0214-1]